MLREAGANLELVKIAVRDIKTKREGVSANLFTTDSNSVVSDPDIDLIIEVIGGIDPAKDLILTAIKNGKSVVTANNPRVYAQRRRAKSQERP